MKHALGCDPCPLDAMGDASFKEMLGIADDDEAALTEFMTPDTLNLENLVREIRDQGAYGTCVGFGMSQAMYNCAYQSGFPLQEYPSAQATYVQARAIDGRLKAAGDGTTIDAAVRALQAGGYLFDSEMPYAPAKRKQGFKLGAGQSGLRRCGLRAHRILDSGDQLYVKIRQLIAGGKGVVGGWLVDQAFEDWTLDKGPWGGLSGVEEGGHCMCVLDYPDGNPRLVNSWGPYVGDRGFWRLTWQALEEAVSLWAIDFVP